MVRKDSERKERILHSIDVDHRLEADKVDIMLTVGEGANEQMIGVVHVKASFAERRTDDVPMSQALVDASYISPLWTMDCVGGPNLLRVNFKSYVGTAKGQRRGSCSARARERVQDHDFFSTGSVRLNAANWQFLWKT